MVSVYPHGFVHALRRFVGLRSAGRRSFALEPQAAPGLDQASGREAPVLRGAGRPPERRHGPCHS